MCLYFLFLFLIKLIVLFFFFFSSRRRHTRSLCDWSSDVCSFRSARRPGQSRPRCGSGLERPAPRYPRSLQAGVQDVEGQDVHAGYDPAELPLLRDGQKLYPLLGHDRRRLGEGVLRGDSLDLPRHDLVHGHPGALQGLPPVFVPVAQRDDAAEDVEKAGGFYVGVLEDEVTLGDDPGQPPVLDDRSPGDARLGEELDGVLDGLLRAQGRPVLFHYVPHLQLSNILLVHAQVPLILVPSPATAYCKRARPHVLWIETHLAGRNRAVSPTASTPGARALSRWLDAHRGRNRRARR